MIQGKILLLLAHPFLHRSRANRTLLTAVEGIDGLQVVDLYERYPDFFIDIPREQQQLREADLIVFQHPIYWYSAPALLKQWQECVLQMGFAYGHGEKALAGKTLMSAVTAGHQDSSYRSDGYDHYTIEEFLRPFEQTARHCGMTYLSPFVLYDSHKMDEPAMTQQAGEYRALLLERLEQIVGEKGDG